MKKILIIEDEADIREVIQYHLKREGFSTETVATGKAGQKSIELESPDLICLDLMLPDQNGLDFCRALKADHERKKIPILMVTAMGEEADIVKGLEVGADDYVCKPFSPKELVARVKSVLRRVHADDEEAPPRQTLMAGGVVIDVSAHKVTVDGEMVSFTATEFRLLHFLASHSGRVFTRDVLIDRGVGEKVFVVDRNVDVHIQVIRKKLGTYRDLIETIRGVGYRFRESDA